LVREAGLPVWVIAVAEFARRAQLRSDTARGNIDKTVTLDQPAVEG
jgi:hypothetical protein